MVEEKKVYVKKESGEKETFDIKKLEHSLKQSGIPSQLKDRVLQEIEKNIPFKSTKEIHSFVHTFLLKHHRGAAGRYNLKKAIMELGPSGYPFEKFVGEIFKAQGFNVTFNVVAKGKCVPHELDVVVTKNQQYFMVECKYHNHAGLKTNVKIPLYIKARFDDMKAQWETTPEHQAEFHQAWVATNTKFTSNAIMYAQCVNIKLIGWSYPKRENLAQLVDKFHLHPITSLSTLTKKQKKIFLSKKLVLCQDVYKNKHVLEELKIPSKQRTKILEESIAICELKK